MRSSPKSSSAWTNSPVKGLVSPSSLSATVDKHRITTQPSTRHQSKRSSQRNRGRISPGNQHTKLWPNGQRHRKSSELSRWWPGGKSLRPRGLLPLWSQVRALSCSYDGHWRLT